MYTFFTILASLCWAWAIYLFTRVHHIKDEGYYDDKLTYVTGGIFICILGVLWFAIAMHALRQQEISEQRYNYYQNYRLN